MQIGVELIGNDYDFMQTSAFPLFISTAIRWLAGVEPIEPFAVAGERSVHAGQFALAGSDYAPPRAGRYPGPEWNREFEVSLAAVGLAGRRRPGPGDPIDRRRALAGLFAWCILAALLLVGGEWWLFQKESHSMNLVFVTPSWLWLLLLVPLFWFLPHRATNRWHAAIRSALATLLILALARPGPAHGSGAIPTRCSSGTGRKVSARRPPPRSRAWLERLPDTSRARVVTLDGSRDAAAGCGRARAAAARTARRWAAP